MQHLREATDIEEWPQEREAVGAASGNAGSVGLPELSRVRIFATARHRVTGLNACLDGLSSLFAFYLSVPPF